MRLVSQRQRSLVFYQSLPSYTQEWEKIALILDASPSINALAWSDLHTDRGGQPKKATGAKGMSAEQVIRFAVVKIKERLSYRDLKDRVADSICLRAFCLVDYDDVPAFTTLQENIKKIRAATWKAINAAVVQYACDQGVEDGECVRIDTTAVKTNIHHPTDSHQLWDGNRVLARILQRIEGDFERLYGAFHNHHRATKRLFYRIHNTRGEDNKKPLYKRLIAYTEKTVGYARVAREALRPERCASFEEILIAAGYVSELDRFIPLVEQVIDQSRRRVLLGEKVPANEKIVSIFEPHTDIIKKGQREIIYGHKVLLTGGRSNLITDCAIEPGNPADAVQFIPAIGRQEQQFGQCPRQVATDAGFASAANAREARDKGVENLMFACARKKDAPENNHDSKVYKRLRKWRSGIEGVISATKRAFGLDRCTWSGFESFKAYVQIAVLAFNLQTLARHLLA
ncbi:MAG TPA: ISNCY family transposase [Candidatus Hydrogenedentes bacterium]|nr:MAG: Transposase DDE domain protein [Candidatus Hydrogenedentes bacterium ADurb.Bin179]HOH28362.1 ISNCY family transposase [Candidatus Hydrogenedentota bacterium]